jgi:hypothetical protein
MGERTAEIGWSFGVDSDPGAGTRIVVEQPAGGTPAAAHPAADLELVERTDVVVRQDGRAVE